MATRNKLNPWWMTRHAPVSVGQAESTQGDVPVQPHCEGPDPGWGRAGQGGGRWMNLLIPPLTQG